MVWVHWVVRLLTHRNCLGTLTEVVSVMVRLLTQRNGILTELGWMVRLLTQRNGILTELGWMVRLLTQAGLGTMRGQVTHAQRGSGYSGW